jgi:hypothetical protein
MVFETIDIYMVQNSTVHMYTCVAELNMKLHVRKVLYCDSVPVRTVYYIHDCLSCMVSHQDSIVPVVDPD